AYGARESIASSLGLDEDDVRVIVEDVGGGFGSKGACVGEEIAVAAAARWLGRPIKWIEDRSENCAATRHGRGQLQEVELAAQRDGVVLGIRSRVLGDLGAYPAPYGMFVPTTVAELQTGCYRIPASQNTLLAVYTNATPTGPYRGAARGSREVREGRSHRPAGARWHGYAHYRLNAARTGSPNHLGSACGGCFWDLPGSGPRAVRGHRPAGLRRGHLRQPKRLDFGG